MHRAAKRVMLIRALKAILSTPPGVRVAIVNVDCPEITPPMLAAVAAALTIQAQQQFALPPPWGYGVGATVRVAGGLANVAANEWPLLLRANADIPGALGYHDQTAAGLPILKIFPRLDKADGVPWSTTASHELLEALADPNIARGAQDRDGVWWAYEVCDGVEADSYLINGIAVSNFALPPYFEPISSRTAKLDWMGRCRTPLEIRPGGYNQFWDPDAGWQQAYNAQQAPRAYRQSMPTRRSARALAQPSRDARPKRP